MNRNISPWLKSISGLLINLSGVWFALAFITPNFISYNSYTRLSVLTWDILFGIVFLVGAVETEKILEQYE